MMNLSEAVTEGPQQAVVITEEDFVFYCAHCQGELVVHREGVGLEVHCPHCRNAITLPESPGKPPAAAAEIQPSSPGFDFSDSSPEQIELRTSELSHQLKENSSQDVEMRGHINRATIELHLLQLKLIKLADRKVAIEAELSALKAARAK